jgi:hypothetical protein
MAYFDENGLIITTQPTKERLKIHQTIKKVADIEGFHISSVYDLCE